MSRPPGSTPCNSSSSTTCSSTPSGEGAAVFLSSHVLPEVERVADRVGVIRAGKLVTVTTIVRVTSHDDDLDDLFLGFYR